MSGINISKRQFIKAMGITTACLAATGSGAAVYALGDTHCLKLKTVNNLLRMGHCAPSVAMTHLNTNCVKVVPKQRIIAGVSGFPGGLAGTGGECGGVTGTVAYLGLVFKSMIKENQYKPALIVGQSFLDGFKKKNHSLFCRHILQEDNIPACVKAATAAPSILVNQMEKLQASRNLNGYPNLEKSAHILKKTKFHCSRDVLMQLIDSLPAVSSLYDAAWGFAGGTLFSGNTCGALTAGIMSIGLKTNRIENSYFRTLKMIQLMMKGDEKAMADDVNHFNISINRSARLAQWFTDKFGSTGCKKLAHLDFNDPEQVSEHFNRPNHICQTIVDETAEKCRKMITSIAA